MDGSGNGGKRVRTVERDGLPVDQVREGIDNTIEVVDEEATRRLLVECIEDPDRDVVDVPRSSSFEFARKFSREFDDRF